MSTEHSSEYTDFCFHLPAPRQDYTLTPTYDSDVDAMVELLNFKEVSFMLLTPPWPFAPKDFLAYLERTKDNFIVHEGVRYTGASAIRNPEGRLVGSVGIAVREGQAVMGYYLHPAYHRKGIMYAALECFIQKMQAIHKWPSLMSGAWIDNQASRNLLLKLGFQEGGTAEVDLRADRGGGQKTEVLYRLTFA